MLERSQIEEEIDPEVSQKLLSSPEANKGGVGGLSVRYRTSGDRAEPESLNDGEYEISARGETRPYNPKSFPTVT